MDQFSKDFGGLHSPDDFDLLSLGLVPGQEEQAETADQDEPRINPLHDMDSLEFLLWVEQEAEREMARRKGQAAEPAPEPVSYTHLDVYKRQGPDSNSSPP